MCRKPIFLISTQVVVLILFVLFAGASASSKKTAKTNNTSSNEQFFEEGALQSKEVTLTVIGTAETEEKATLQALRSALEQTYGAFVSSSTTIENDTLIKDEIVSIASGIVKKYNKLAVATLPNGQISVSLIASIAVNEFVSYAQSKGSKLEFSGNVYAANLSLLKLKIAANRKAYIDLFAKLKELAPFMYTFELCNLSDPLYFEGGDIKVDWQLGGGAIEIPKKIYKFNCTIKQWPNLQYHECAELYFKTKEELQLSPSEIELCEQNKLEYDVLTYDDVRNSYYEVIKEIFNAMYRFRVEEINNPQNKYEFRKTHVPAYGVLSMGSYSILDRYFSDSGVSYPFYSYFLKCYIRGRDGKINYRFIDEQGHNIGKDEIIPFSILCYERGLEDILKEGYGELIKTPIKLSSKQKKEVKNGTYKGRLYDVSYFAREFCRLYRVSVFIAADDMEKFKGFEVIY